MRLQTYFSFAALYFIFLLMPCKLYSYSIIDTVLNDGKKFFIDYSYIATDVYSSKKDILMGAFALGVISYSSSYYDESLNPSETNRKTLTPLKQFGELHTGIGLPISLYCFSLIIDNYDLRQTSIELSEAISFAALINLTLKYSFGRARPFMNTGNSNFQYFEPSNNYQSFPSGHTTLAFTISSYFAQKIDTWWSYPLFYTGALLTGYERIQSGNHWFSDVVCGAAIGIFSSYTVLNLKENRDFSLSPFYNYNTNSIGLVYSF